MAFKTDLQEGGKPSILAPVELTQPRPDPKVREIEV
jgi:hypothetical protein